MRRLVEPLRLAEADPAAMGFFRSRRHRLGSLLALLVLPPLLAGCVASLPRGGEAGAVRNGATPSAVRRPLVLTTVLPITLFTRAVAGPCAEVRPLVEGAAGAHDLQATPAQLARLRQARVLVVNGLGLERHLDRLVAGSGNTALRLLDASRSLGPTAVASGTHPGTDSGAHPGHVHQSGAVNPHVWLDPQRAARQVETIRDGLIAADPACRASYLANAAAFLAELRRLDADLSGLLAPYAGRRFLAFHDLAPYFAERYHLQADALVAVPDQSPSAADLQRLQRQVRASGLRALVSEPQAGSRAFTALARDLNLPVVIFDPLETVPAGTPLTPSLYGTTMRRNGRSLVRAFGG